MTKHSAQNLRELEFCTFPCYMWNYEGMTETVYIAIAIPQDHPVTERYANSKADGYEKVKSLVWDAIKKKPIVFAVMRNPVFLDDYEYTSLWVYLQVTIRNSDQEAMWHVAEDRLKTIATKIAAAYLEEL